jgi:hypothetical protein
MCPPESRSELQEAYRARAAGLVVAWRMAIGTIGAIGTLGIVLSASINCGSGFEISYH